MIPTEISAHTNWVDPDILAFNDGNIAAADQAKEEAFKTFFETTWHTPQFNHLRQKWDSQITDESPLARVLAKTALWSVIQLRIAQQNAITPKTNQEGTELCQH